MTFYQTKTHGASSILNIYIYIYRLLRLKEETTEKKKIGDRLPLISIAADILGGRPIIHQINNRIHHNLWHHLKVLKNWITLEERDCSQHEKEKT